MQKFNFKTDLKASGKRVDKYLASQIKDFSRSYIQQLIQNGSVKINNRVTQKSYKLKKGDNIEVTAEEKSLDIKAVDIELEIVYEDKDIIVINKDYDMVVHPAPGHYEDTLVNALLAHADDLSAINGVKRPGIVHRLDKDTTGVMVAAKNDKAHKNLALQFKNREVDKYYLALLEGVLPYEKGKIDAPIGRDPNNRKKMAVRKRKSKKALSRFKVLERFENNTLVEVKIETGRTHQIRVHFSYLGYPVVGDKKYGSKNYDEVERQLLHAERLIIKHPSSGEKMEFKAELKNDFKKVLNTLRKEN